ncbi:hypothetical protein BJV78DRAFT_1130587 [Lactifluus subvellereus]|nr:hypothetical protein BJV78DRAFT_1130587 [Lactifluus subvellereus]
MSDTGQSLEHAAIPVLHDETHHENWYSQPQINSIGNLPNLTGYLEHHAPSTDGSFAIYIAPGNVTLVSKRLYESIPEQHRPPLDANDAGNPVAFRVGSSTQEALGSTVMPVVLTDATSGRRFCIKLYALVLENMLMGMFIGTEGINFIERTDWGRGRVTYNMKFRNGRWVQVVHNIHVGE